MKRNKKREKGIVENINKIQNILDKEYFHTSIKIINGNTFTWEIYYRNLPNNLYYSNKNKPLLTSKNNTIKDIYKLKQKFNLEKKKCFIDNWAKFFKFDIAIIDFTSNIRLENFKNYIVFYMLILMAILLNALFFNNLEFSFLLIGMTIATGLTCINNQKRLNKIIEKEKIKIKEIFVKNEIRKQGLYFVNKLREGENEQ